MDVKIDSVPASGSRRITRYPEVTGEMAVFHDSSLLGRSVNLHFVRLFSKLGVYPKFQAAMSDETGYDVALICC